MKKVYAQYEKQKAEKAGKAAELAAEKKSDEEKAEQMKSAGEKKSIDESL